MLVHIWPHAGLLHVLMQEITTVQGRLPLEALHALHLCDDLGCLMLITDKVLDPLHEADALKFLILGLVHCFFHFCSGIIKDELFSWYLLGSLLEKELELAKVYAKD